MSRWFKVKLRFFVDFLLDFLQPYTLLRSFVEHVLTLSHKKCLRERFFV